MLLTRVVDLSVVLPWCCRPQGYLEPVRDFSVCSLQFTLEVCVFHVSSIDWKPRGIVDTMNRQFQVGTYVTFQKPPE